MKIAILLYDGYIALDMIGPYEILNRMPQAKVTFVAEKAGPVQSDTTMLTIMAEKSLAEMPKPDVHVGRHQYHVFAYEAAAPRDGGGYDAHAGGLHRVFVQFVRSRT